MTLKDDADRIESEWYSCPQIHDFHNTSRNPQGESATVLASEKRGVQVAEDGIPNEDSDLVR